MTRILATIPIRITSTQNERLHYMVKAKRAKVHRQSAAYGLFAVSTTPSWPRIKVVLTRIAPKQITDKDNLIAGFKATRDGVADWLGIDDGSDRLTWEYQQAKGRPNTYEVLIEVMESAP